VGRGRGLEEWRLLMVRWKFLTQMSGACPKKKPKVLPLRAYDLLTKRLWFTPHGATGGPAQPPPTNLHGADKN